MCDELCEQDLELLPLPKDWTENVRHAVLNVIGIVRIAMLTDREFLIREGYSHVAQFHRLETEVATLREELRINGARCGGPARFGNSSGWCHVCLIPPKRVIKTRWTTTHEG